MQNYPYNTQNVIKFSTNFLLYCIAYRKSNANRLITYTIIFYKILTTSIWR